MEWTKSPTISFFFLLIITCIFGILFSKSSIYFKWSFNHQYVLNFFTSTEKLSKLSVNNSHSYPTKSYVLLLYVYADIHQHAYGNLKYFIDTAVREGDGVDYIFILQQVNKTKINEADMPVLPKTNAYYFQHENECFDYGTMGWFIAKYTYGNPHATGTSVTDTNNTYTTRKFNLAQYKYFIFMNSSSRGPFFPPYFLKYMFDYYREFKEPFYWYYVFTKRINNKVKLVGCTISCTTPKHVQSYFLTTDFDGLSALLKTGGKDGSERPGVFGCYGSQQEVIWLSEMSFSTRIMEAGYMIDCILTKYQGAQFTHNSSDQCSIYGPPYKDKNMDGTSLEPYEVVFVKYNDKPFTTDAQERAKLYEKWLEQAKTKNRTSW